MTTHGLPTAKEMTTALMESIRNLGGRASVKELEHEVSKRLQLSAEQLAVPHDKSRTEFQYRLAWTRSYAKKAGLLVSTERNRWSLPNS